MKKDGKIPLGSIGCFHHDRKSLQLSLQWCDGGCGQKPDWNLLVKVKKDKESRYSKIPLGGLALTGRYGKAQKAEGMAGSMGDSFEWKEKHNF